MSIVSGPYQCFSVGLGQIVSHVSNNLPATELTLSEEQFVACTEKITALACVNVLASYSSTATRKMEL